jgi:hypothetical protein
MPGTTVSSALRRIQGRLAADTGTSLIEIVVAAALLAVVAVGVMSGLDVSARVSGDQKGKAVAANIAEGELERIRSLDAAQIATLNGAPVTRSEGGVNYTVRSTAEWVRNQDGDAFACSADGGTTYLKLQVSVKWPGSDKPVVLDSIFAPGVRSAVRSIGALALRVVNQQQQPVPGVSFTLTSSGQSNRTGVTDQNGCVVWSAIPAAVWRVSGTKTNFITPTGNASITDEVSVPGQSFVKKQYEFSQGGTISGSFFTTRPGSGTQIPTAPGRYVIAHSAMNYQGNSYRVIDIPEGQTTFTTPTLYPYGSPYTIWGGGCTSAPASPGIATPTLSASGGSVSGVRVKLPALDIVTKDPGPEGGPVRAVACGETYNRHTGGDGKLADPGFPYGNVDLCAQLNSDSPSAFSGAQWYRKWASWSNTDYNGRGFGDEYQLEWKCTFWSIWFVCVGTWYPDNGFGAGTC